MLKNGACRRPKRANRILTTIALCVLCNAVLVLAGLLRGRFGFVGEVFPGGCSRCETFLGVQGGSRAGRDSAPGGRKIGEGSDDR